MTMETKIVRISGYEKQAEVIEAAGKIIRDGGLVAFPTETVYGLGGDAFNPSSSRKIYAAKGRPSDNPLIVHIADIDDLHKVAVDIPDAAYKLADKFWPGPLTMIFRKAEKVPRETTGGLDTVAVRFPSDPVASAFIRAAGGFVAAPSANLSGRPSPTSAKYVVQDMDGRIDMIICGDDSQIGLESTIIDLTSDVPMVLRPGFITPDDLRSVISEVAVDETVIRDDSSEAPKAPGMKYRHYAPKGELTIIEGNPDSTVSYINNAIASDRKQGLKTGVIVFSGRKDDYSADIVMNAGAGGPEAAHRLFSVLRAMDDEEVDRIYAESFAREGIGMAVMNRLMKAAGHNIIHL